jgi:signal peptidase II
MIISLFFSLFLLSLDRLTKMLILTSSFSYPGKFLRIQLSKNPNLFFLSINSTLIIIIGLAITLVLFLTLIKAWHQKNILAVTSLLLIISGGLSNLYDRLAFNYVIDWLWLAILPISIFNLADVMITAGCTLLLIQLLRSQH